MNKRGQFYLIAAMVIVGLAAGFILVTNKVTTPQNPNVNYLKGEISTESSNIISYGISNSKSDNEIESMLINLSKYYVNNAPAQNFYFLFGTPSNITLLAHQKYSYNVSLNGNVLSIGNDTLYQQSFSSLGNSINIKINGTSYNFNVKQGENFHFVIKSLNGGQDYTISN